VSAPLGHMGQGKLSRPPLPLVVAAAVLVAIVAGLAFQGGTASGLETAPENITPPKVTPASPRTEDTVTTTNGVWANGPTSFTYAWYRCKGLESCATISGATSSTYTPVEADLGSTLRALVTATNGAGSASAFSPVTAAVIGPLHWYSCTEVGGISGGFEDSACTKAAKGPFEWTKVAAGASTGFQVSGTSAVTLGWTMSGVGISISCSSQSGSGSLENPTGGGAGNLSGTLKLSGCTVTKPAGKGCKISGGSITTNSLKGMATEPEEKPLVKLQPSSGTTLFSMTMEGCSTSGLNQTYVVTGSFQGILLPSNSSLEFTKASTTGITVNGLQGSLEGTLKIQTTTGARPLKLAS
jgi:hypothetical protein